MPQPYQEISIFGGEGCLDHDTLNSPERFQIIWLLPLASLGLIKFFFSPPDPWAIDPYSPVGSSEGPDLALGMASNGTKIGECTYQTILNKVLL